MQIQISWLLQNKTDLDLHCLLRQGMSCSAREGLIKNNLTELYFSRRSCVICRTKLPALTLSTLGKIFSRLHIEIFFLFFPRKMDLLFHANCLFSADDILKYFPYFSQKTGLDISIGYNSLEMSNPVFWKKISSVSAVLALREVCESETPKNCPGTSKNQCQKSGTPNF